MTIAPDNQRAPGRKRPIPDVIMLLAILWLRLPVAFASSTSIHILVLVPFGLGVTILLPLARPDRRVTLLGMLAGTFVLLIVVALLRGGSAGVYESLRHVIFEDLGICLLVVFGYLYFASAVTESDWAHRMFILCCAPGVYVAVNAVLHLAGFHGPTNSSPYPTLALRPNCWGWWASTQPVSSFHSPMASTTLAILQALLWRSLQSWS